LLIKKALGNYDASLKIVPLFASKKNIVLNYNLASKFLDFYYVYYCNLLFNTGINKITLLLKDLHQLVKIFNQEIVYLKKWEKTDLKSCVNYFQKSALLNISLAYQNIDFFNKLKP
jgi:hypothetical protein